MSDDNTQTANPAFRAPVGSANEAAESLLRIIAAEMQYKADCFDYLCWLEETQQSDCVKGAKFLVLASDGTTCWGHSYSDAVKVAMHHDKELYDAVCDMRQNAEVSHADQKRKD